MSSALGQYVAVPKLFMKNIIQANIVAEGTTRDFGTTLRSLITFTQTETAVAASCRDVIFRYANLLLCDGFVAKQPPSPTIVKQSLELIDSTINAASSSNIMLSAYDLDCALCVIMGRLEQFNSSSMKQVVLKQVEHIYRSAAEPFEVVEWILQNMVGKQMRYGIRQVPTRVEIVRFALACIYDCIENSRVRPINNAMIQAALSFYQSSGVDVF